MVGLRRAHQSTVGENHTKHFCEAKAGASRDAKPAWKICPENVPLEGVLLPLLAIIDCKLRSGKQSYYDVPLLLAYLLLSLPVQEGSV